MVVTPFIVANTTSKPSPDVRPIRDAARRRTPLGSTSELSVGDIELAERLVEAGLLGHGRFFELMQDELGEAACLACVGVVLRVCDTPDLDETFDDELSLVFERFGESAVLAALQLHAEGPPRCRTSQIQAFLAAHDPSYRAEIAHRFIGGDYALFEVIAALGFEGVDAVWALLAERGVTRDEVRVALAAPSAEQASSRLGLSPPVHSAAAGSG